MVRGLLKKSKPEAQVQSKAMRDYAQSRQYHIIVEIRRFRSCYQFQRFNLKVKPYEQNLLKVFDLIKDNTNTENENDEAKKYKVRDTIIGYNVKGFN